MKYVNLPIIWGLSILAGMSMATTYYDHKRIIVLRDHYDQMRRVVQEILEPGNVKEPSEFKKI